MASHKLTIELLRLRNDDDNVLCCFVRANHTVCERVYYGRHGGYEFCTQHYNELKDIPGRRTVMLERLGQFFEEINKDDVHPSTVTVEEVNDPMETTGDAPQQSQPKQLPTPASG